MKVLIQGMMTPVMAAAKNMFCWKLLAPGLAGVLSVVAVSGVIAAEPVAGGNGEQKRAAALSSDWRDEQWIPEDFTGVLGGGPSMGPAAEAGVWAIALCGDKAGNIYMQTGNSIDIVTAGGVLHRLAGTGARGYRDGLANQAQFDQGADYNTAKSIQCDGLGNIYTAENGNARIRRIFKDSSGKWMVDTVAGGGKRRLNQGESCPPLEVDLGGNIAVVSAPDGTLTIGGMWNGIFRVSADRKSITHLGGWPVQSGGNPCLVMADGDRLGNAYFVWRGNDGGVERVSVDGKIEHIGGMPHDEFLKVAKQGKPHHIGDGLPMTIYIDTPTSLAAKPDGSCVYTCGGDEYAIRRVPTDMKSVSSTMVVNGSWYTLPVHPARNGGYRNHVNPALTGKSAAEGGPLTTLDNCHISGRDYEGNLYGFLYNWQGPTLSVEGKGLLKTGLYRIRRVK